MSKIEKSPALPFYGKDFFDDERVKYLTLAGWGLYIALLWRQWTEGSIPADLTKMAAILGRPEKEIRAAWDGVSQFFHEIEPERLANRKLEKVRTAMLDVRTKRAQNPSKDKTKTDQLLKFCKPLHIASANENGFDVDFEFESIWMDVIEKQIPDPVGKKASHKSFAASIGCRECVADLRKALANYRASDRVHRKFIQNASTWFNNWRDWVSATPKPASGPDALPIVPFASEPAKDRLRDLIGVFRNRVGSRPSEPNPRRSVWDAAFLAEFGFSPDDFIDADEDQCAKWLASLKVTA
jgi:uncharacterized protein YdaU (DUF1376 family)